MVASLPFYSYLAKITHPAISIPMRSHEFKSELPQCRSINNKVVLGLVNVYTLLPTGTVSVLSVGLLLSAGNVP